MVDAQLRRTVHYHTRKSLIKLPQIYIISRHTTLSEDILRSNQSASKGLNSGSPLRGCGACTGSNRQSDMFGRVGGADQRQRQEAALTSHAIEHQNTAGPRSSGGRTCVP